MPQTPSSRWCPTPEQVMILEEMYRSGVRTPNASQIQQITAHLSLYGKIEGKNVFYWFQNHKARDRQKLRRRLTRHHHLLHAAFNPLPPPPPPPPQFYHQSPPPLHFLQQQQGSPQEEEAATQGMNLLCKLESSEGSSSCGSTAAAAWGYDWMESCRPCCCSSSRPLRTLELFPTASTGVKDDCTTSSSCSTSTNY